MKKICLLALVILFSANSYSATWVKLKKVSKYENVISYDSDSLKRESNFVTAWIKDDGHDIQKRKYDCGNQRYLLLYVKPFDNSGEVNFSNNVQFTGISIDDGFNVNVMKQVCGLYGLKP